MPKAGTDEKDYGKGGLMQPYDAEP